jgi:DNA-directed RNA polymerase subunit RPC12/RpoP
MARLTDAEMEARGYSVWLCMDCGSDTNKSEEYYMLWHKVWRRINYKLNGMLCLNCSERRLGRPLNVGDFTKAPVNSRQAAVCAELAIRLAREVHFATATRSAKHARKVGGDV